jgi:hypothetical protein
MTLPNISFCLFPHQALHENQDRLKKQSPPSQRPQLLRSIPQFFRLGSPCVTAFKNLAVTIPDAEAALALLVGACLVMGSPLPLGSVVMTGQGPVQGLQGSGFRASLGIPYAAAPLGDLRFAAPQPAPRFAVCMFSAVLVAYLSW